jgi:hypothetical protein
MNFSTSRMVRYSRVRKSALAASPGLLSQARIGGRPNIQRGSTFSAMTPSKNLLSSLTACARPFIDLCHPCDGPVTMLDSRRSGRRTSPLNVRAPLNVWSPLTIAGDHPAESPQERPFTAPHRWWWFRCRETDRAQCPLDGRALGARLRRAARQRVRPAPLPRRARPTGPGTMCA